MKTGPARKVNKAFKKRLVFHRKRCYLFEHSAILTRQDNRISIDDGRKKTAALNSFLIDEESAKNEDYDLGFAVSAEGSGVYDHYKEILDFHFENPKLNISQFEKALKNDLVLCTFFKYCDIDYINNLIDQISAAMPHLIEVFRRPVTHLIELETIVPVDTAKHITAKTVRHLMVHSENWECIKKGSIVPKSVLTKTYDDDFSIYENIVFKTLIDKVLRLLKKQLYYLSVSQQLYNEAVSIDAFSRLNHEQYYGAIGLLYSGFFNMEEAEETSGAIRKIKQLLKLLARYLGHPVYAKNLNAKAIIGPAKQTNILLMHKDYKVVYALYQSLGSGDNEDEPDIEGQQKGQRAYEKFCEYLMLFSLRNFNFDEMLEFNKWKAGIKPKKLEFLDINALELVVGHKKARVKYLFIPNAYYLGSDRIKNYGYIKDRLGGAYDKIIFCEPFECEGEFLPISIIDINSFRKFQRLILEAMLVADRDKNLCAFCGEGIAQGRCKRCRLVIEETVCGCGHRYAATRVDGAKSNIEFKIINEICPNCQGSKGEKKL